MRVEVNLFREMKVNSGRGELESEGWVILEWYVEFIQQHSHECSTVDSFYSLSYECMGACVYVHACSVTNHGT